MGLRFLTYPMSHKDFVDEFSLEAPRRDSAVSETHTSAARSAMREGWF